MSTGPATREQVIEYYGIAPEHVRLMETAQPPRLVSRSKAALILGIPGPHIGRLVNAGRLTPVTNDGTAPAYQLPQVRELAGELERERAARRKARAE